ncbi:MAG: porin [Candidatus Lernaella stagnicola]|nr:porin [Candidatus Lernaella stagnicola]
MRWFTLILAAVVFLGAAAIPATAADSPRPPKFNVVGNDGVSSLKIGLSAQMLYEYYQKDMGDDAHSVYTSTLFFKRIRPSLAGTLVDPRLSFKFQADVAPGKLDLLDYYVNFKAHEWFAVQAGQYKIPFTRYRLNSYKNLQLVDWPLTAKYFGGERQMGLQFHNSNHRFFEYQAALLTGMYGDKNGTGLSKVTGEAVLNTWNMVESQAVNEFHPAVAARVLGKIFEIDTSTVTDFAKKGPRLAVGAGSIYDANPVVMRDFSFRPAAELFFKAYGASVYGAYFAGFYEQNGEADKRELGMTGMHVEGGYLALPWLEVAGRYARVDVTDTLQDDAAEYAAAQIAAADDPDAAGLQYGKAGSMGSESEAAVGLNFYLRGHAIKLANEAAWLTHVDKDDESLQDFRFRSMMQVAF